MHAKPAREIDPPQIRRVKARRFKQDFNARANRRLGLQQQRHIHFADAQRARAVRFRQPQCPLAVVSEAVLHRQFFPRCQIKSSRRAEQPAAPRRGQKIHIRRTAKSVCPRERDVADGFGFELKRIERQPQVADRAVARPRAAAQTAAFKRRSGGGSARGQFAAAL